MRYTAGFPVPGGKAQIDVVVEDPTALQQVATQLGLKLSDRKRAFLVQGEDRVGAMSGYLDKLAAQGVSIVGSQAVTGGAGRWGMMLWVKPQDYQRTGQALGL